MQPDPSILAIALLAFIAGFATQRGSVCGVVAARQIVETGRSTKLMAFLTAALCALVVVVPLAWVAPNRFHLGASYSGAGITVLGGALLGLGSVINGGCVFGTASRVLSGNLSFLATFPGLALGAGVADGAGLSLLATSQTASPLRDPSVGAVVLLLLAAALAAAAVVNVVRIHARAGLRITTALRAGRWRTSLAMLVIGVTGGLLFAAGGGWSYPSLLRQLGNLALGQPATFTATMVAGPLALVAGGVVAARIGGRWLLQAFDPVQVGRSFVGGVMMGIAAIIVPGGNDSLLLASLPSLAVHGAIAYPIMLAVQLAVLYARSRWTARPTT